MNDEEYYRDLNAELGAEFDFFVIDNPDWFDKNIPNGATVVLQTDDPGFSAWTRQVAEHNRSHDAEPTPMVLVHVREISPRKSRIVRLDAEPVVPGGPPGTRRAG